MKVTTRGSGWVLIWAPTVSPRPGIAYAGVDTVPKATTPGATTGGVMNAAPPLFTPIGTSGVPADGRGVTVAWRDHDDLLLVGQQRADQGRNGFVGIQVVESPGGAVDDHDLLGCERREQRPDDGRSIALLEFLEDDRPHGRARLSQDLLDQAERRLLLGNDRQAPGKAEFASAASSLPSTHSSAPTASASRIAINCDSASRRRSVELLRIDCRSILIRCTHSFFTASSLSSASRWLRSSAETHRPLYFTRPWIEFSSSRVTQ